MVDVSVKVLTQATDFSLISLDELKTMLGIAAGDTSSDASLTLLITRYSDIISVLCDRVFAFEKVEETWRDLLGNRLFTTHWPIRQIFTAAAPIATSATSIIIGLGSKTFETQADLAYTVGGRARISSDASPTHLMEGFVTSYIGTSLIVNVDTIGTAGTHGDWNIILTTPGIESITVDGTLLDPSDYELEERSGKVLLFGSRSEPIVITYSGGFNLPTEAPAALKQAAEMLVSAARRQTAQVVLESGPAVRMIAHKEARVMYHPPSKETSSSSSSSSGAIPVQVEMLLSRYMRVWA